MNSSYKKKWFPFTEQIVHGYLFTLTEAPQKEKGVYNTCHLLFKNHFQGLLLDMNVRMNVNHEWIHRLTFDQLTAASGSKI